jgi:hypothetical protein
MSIVTLESLNRDAKLGVYIGEKLDCVGKVSDLRRERNADK